MKLNIGAGPTHRPAGWLAVDLNTDADIQGDVLAGLPLEDHVADRILCSHVLEHIYWHDIPAFLAELKRVLRPDGRLLAIGPDILRACRLSREGALPWGFFLSTLESNCAASLNEQYPHPWEHNETLDLGQPEDGFRHRWNCYERRMDFALTQAGFDTQVVDLADPASHLDGWPVISRDTWQCCVLGRPHRD